MINVPYRTAGGYNWVAMESRLLLERKVFILGEITASSACEFVQKIIFLTGENNLEEIKIYINSPGGEVDAGLLIYDTLKGLRVKYSIFCIGMAASMAAIILAGGPKGRRFLLPHSKVMIHEPLIAGNVGGSASSIQKTAESILETKKIAVELLASDTGKSISDVETALSFDNYMNAKEAVQFGICDEIIRAII